MGFQQEKLSDLDLFRIAERAKETLAKRNYRDYLVYVHKGRYRHFRHTLLIANELQRIADGESRFVIIELPPRHGKSLTGTESFPSFYLAKNPDKRVIATSYSDSLARKFGRLNRDKIAEFGRLFGVKVSKENRSTNDWSIEGKAGGMIATGIGGSITGQGADCFPAGTKIQTIDGPMNIEDLHSMDKPPLILSYDHAENKLVYKQVTATRRTMANDFTQIRTEQGRVIESTADHRYYVNQRGYEQAHLLRPGDRITSATVKNQQDLFELQKREERSWSALQRVLPSITESGSSAQMHTLSKRFPEEEIRVRQGYAKQSEADRFLLLSDMQSSASCSQKQQALSGMRRKETQRQQVLQSSLSESGSRKTVETNVLSAMSEGISTNQQPNNVLQQKMRGRCSFNAYDRQAKQSLQNRDELREVVPLHASAYFRTRQSLLCDVPITRSTADLHESGSLNQEIQSRHSSHRRRSGSQSSGKPDNDVQDVPCYSSQIGEDAISSVSTTSGGTKPVYDLQVDGTNNFFANEILVHNCLIIDDPFKNATEANSPTMRKKVWDEWESTLSTRLHTNASVIVIMTRWHEDDLVARLLQNKAREWTRIRLPAIAEEDDLLGRAIGEALCPELGYDEEWAKTKKIEVGSRTWDALFQQRPAPGEGAMIKRNQIKFYTVLPSGVENDVLESWDLTFKDSVGADSVSGQKWGRLGADMYLIDRVNDVMDFPATLTAIRAFNAKHGSNRILIEDKANGPAVISTLKREISGIIPVEPIGNKVARVAAIAPYWEAGNVYLPDPSIAPWVYDYIEQIVSFPFATHDDDVDAMSQALNRFKMEVEPNIRELG